MNSPVNACIGIDLFAEMYIISICIFNFVEEFVRRRLVLLVGFARTRQVREGWKLPETIVEVDVSKISEKPQVNLQEVLIVIAHASLSPLAKSWIGRNYGCCTVEYVSIQKFPEVLRNHVRPTWLQPLLQLYVPR